MGDGAHDDADLDRVLALLLAAEEFRGGDVDPAARDDLDEAGRARLRRRAEVVARNFPEPQNDTGNARRLLNWHGAGVAHVREVGWHVWDGRRWWLDGGETAVLRHAQTTAAAIRLEAYLHEMPPPENGKEAVRAVEAAITSRRRFAVTSGNISRLRGMADVAATHVSWTPDDLDTDPLAINLENGTLRVVVEESAGECSDPLVRFRLDPHAEGDRISKLAPVRYEPEAPCPLWEAFVARFLPDPDVRWFVQKFHGLALTGLSGEQILLFHHGAGANGKSTFIETICRLMGDNARTLPAEAFAGSQQRRSDQATPEFARLVGARFVRAAELPRGEPLKEEVIKLLTGGEPMLVRHLNRGFFEMTPVFKASMTGNHKPHATGSDYAVWRRLRLVPWTVTLPETERRPLEHVLAEFAGERAGILNWLLEGLAGYLTEGLAAPDAVLEATEDYRAEMDPIGEFLKGCVEEAAGEEVQARTLYHLYVDWCAENAVKSTSETWFAKQCAAHGLRKTKGARRQYLDVRIKYWPAASSRAGLAP